MPSVNNVTRQVTHENETRHDTDAMFPPLPSPPLPKYTPHSARYASQIRYVNCIFTPLIPPLPPVHQEQSVPVLSKGSNVKYLATAKHKHDLSCACVVSVYKGGLEESVEDWRCWAMARIQANGNVNAVLK